MSKTTSKQRKSASSPSGVKRVTETRIDAPHAMTTTMPDDASPACVVAEPPPIEHVEAPPVESTGEGASPRRLLQSQAAQLAEHLQHRQQELDHREAQVNMRAAQLENDARAARLWLGEHQTEIDRRNNELAEQQAELRACLARLAAAESAAERRRLQLEAREERLHAQTAAQAAAEKTFETGRQRAEDALRLERQRIDVRREASLALIRQLHAGIKKHRGRLEALPLASPREPALPVELRAAEKQLAAREQELLAATEALHQRRAEFDHAECQLDEARQENERIRRELDNERETLRRRARSEQERLAAEQRRDRADLDEKRKALARQSEHVDQCRASLEQLRAELGQMHRSTLEIRLATEELWVRLSGAAPPAALTQSLGEIRARLAEDYRMAGVELSEQKRELTALGEELRQEHEKLLKQKRRLEQWAQKRDEEIQTQAARLVAREQELDRQESERRRGFNRADDGEGFRRPSCRAGLLLAE